MKIMTYNIHGWRTTDGRPNLHQLAQVIADTGADIVALNEVFYPRIIEGAEIPALEALAERLHMEFVFGPCLRWPAQDHMPADAYGNALLSRWPIGASAAHHLSPVEGKEPRGLLEARIHIPERQPFTVYVTHLDHTDEEARLIQLRAVRTWTVRDRNRPHVVMGDFNAVSPWDHAHLMAQSNAPSTNRSGGEQGPRVVAQMEKAGYTDAFRLFGAPGARSFIPAAHPIRIDYIFASQPLVPALQSCQIWIEPDGAEASDHRPVLAEIDWS